MDGWMFERTDEKNVEIFQLLVNFKIVNRDEHQLNSTQNQDR